MTAISNNTDAVHSADTYPGVLRFFAHLFSYIFHPLFIPLYAMFFMIDVHPSFFSGFDRQTKMWLTLTVGQLTLFYPLLTVLLLKQLKFIKSFFLHDQKDRIIPYIGSGVFYFWMFQVCRNYPITLSPVVTSFMLGVFLTSSAALIANIYFKISMHAMGVGGLIGLFLVIMKTNTMLMTWPLSLALLIAGLVCTSRLIISDHSPRDIYMGLLAGILCQFAAAMIMM